MLICQLTDLHVRPVGKSSSRISETNMFTERAFRAVARLDPRPDVVVITGDLTECGLDAEYANLLAMLRRWLPMPVFVIPGNHDRRDNFRAGLRHASAPIRPRGAGCGARPSTSLPRSPRRRRSGPMCRALC